MSLASQVILMISGNFIQAMNSLHSVRSAVQRRFCENWFMLRLLICFFGLSPVVSVALAAGPGEIRSGLRAGRVPGHLAPHSHARVHALGPAHERLQLRPHSSHNRAVLGAIGTFGLLGAFDAVPAWTTRGQAYGQIHWNGRTGPSMHSRQTIIYSSPIIRYASAEPVVPTVIAPAVIIDTREAGPLWSPATSILPTVAGPAESAADWWYVCEHPAGYYPQVQVCPEGWQKRAAH